MSNFLDRIAALASATPCRVPRAELLRLLILAGLGDTDAFRAVTNMTADAVTVDPAALLQVIAMVPSTTV